MKNNRDSEDSTPANSEPGFSFLLRAWAEKPIRPDATITWRYSLRNITTRAQRGFADLESLMAYFRGIESESKWHSDSTAADNDR